MKDYNNKKIEFKMEDLKFINERKEISKDDLADGLQFENQKIELKSKLPKARSAFKNRR